MLLINMPATDFERRHDILYKKLSMSVQLLLENLVGRVILGKKL